MNWACAPGEWPVGRIAGVDRWRNGVYGAYVCGVIMFWFWTGSASASGPEIGVGHVWCGTGTGRRVGGGRLTLACCLLPAACRLDSAPATHGWHGWNEGSISRHTAHFVLTGSGWFLVINLNVAAGQPVLDYSRAPW